MTYLYTSSDIPLYLYTSSDILLRSRWRWADGDLVMVDNLAVAHLASPGTQKPPTEEVGLRLMRRTTVEGICYSILL